jgi:hypothetical protein
LNVTQQHRAAQQHIHAFESNKRRTHAIMQ